MTHIRSFTSTQLVYFSFLLISKRKSRRGHDITTISLFPIIFVFFFILSITTTTSFSFLFCNFSSFSSFEENKKKSFSYCEKKNKKKIFLRRKTWLKSCMIDNKWRQLSYWQSFWRIPIKIIINKNFPHFHYLMMHFKSKTCKEGMKSCSKKKHKNCKCV